VQLRGDDSGGQRVRTGEALQPAQTARRWSKLTPGPSVMDSLGHRVELSDGRPLDPPLDWSIADFFRASNRTFTVRGLKGTSPTLMMDVPPVWRHR
jgi:hypothetical protein